MSHPYESLAPDLILDAVAGLGLQPDGHLLALNSYENRVFQIGIDERPPLVAKFYRPERWASAAIREEHAYALELAASEIPVVPPMRGPNGDTLFEHGGFRFALFDRRGGRAPEPGDLAQLTWIGRFLGRIHMTGAAQPFAQRPDLGVDDMGWIARDTVLRSPLLPLDLASRYAMVSEQLLARVAAEIAAVATAPVRLHGDCHYGNILWTEQGPHFVDLDDCRNGPAIQDLWMLLSGERAERMLQLDALLEGYQTFADLDRAQLALIEPLRGLRMVHYNGWLARRWSDPAFPAAFPWAATTHFWAQHVEDLRQQLAAIDEPTLQLL